MLHRVIWLIAVDVSEVFVVSIIRAVIALNFTL
jgi:hypothetical protein